MPPDNKNSGRDYVSVSNSDKSYSPVTLVLENNALSLVTANPTPLSDIYPGPWLPNSLLSSCLIWPTEKQFYTNMHEIPEEPMLVPVPVNLCRNITRKSSFKGLVPYKLEKPNIVLFPEWYHLFIKRIAKISPELNAYCKYSPASFLDCFDGSYEDAVDAEREVIEQFSESFKANLGILFDSDKDFVYTRQYVENYFAESFKEYIGYMPMLRRKNQLIQFAKRGKFDPLVNFLQAYCVPEHTIWMQLLEVCLPNGVSEETRLDVADKYEKAKNYQPPTNNARFGIASNLFEDQIRIFHSALEKDGYFPISDASQITQPSVPQIVKKRKLPEESGVLKKGKFGKEYSYHFPQEELGSVGSRKRAFKNWREQSSQY